MERINHFMTIGMCCTEIGQMETYHQYDHNALQIVQFVYSRSRHTSLIINGSHAHLLQLYISSLYVIFLLDSSPSRMWMGTSGR